ncbi:hypothetical protein B9K06_26570, partial [Bacillus sp. OG2]
IPFKNQINLKIDFSIIDNSILATDMENHDYFVSKISNLKFDFNNFKLLSINQDLILNATCGKLVSDIMSNDWLEAKNELVKLRE